MYGLSYRRLELAGQTHLKSEDSKSVTVSDLEWIDLL